MRGPGLSTPHAGASRPPLLIFGASGHAAVVADLVEAAGTWTVGGAVDTIAEAGGGKLLDIPIGRLDDFSDQWPVVVAIGDNDDRARIVSELRDLGRTFARPLVHPHASVSPHARIGEGTVVMAGAVINARASIGAHVIVNTGASADHDCELGDLVHLSPGVRLAGRVRVGTRTHIGTGACVIPRVGIGADCVIGAGAVVVRDVADRQVAVGNPARLIRSR